MVFCIVSQELGEQPIAGVEGDQAGQTTERRGARSNDINIGKHVFHNIKDSANKITEEIFNLSRIFNFYLINLEWSE